MLPATRILDFYVECKKDYRRFIYLKFPDK
nr:MAG TPA: hypothetical protein [Caudoviricetes sp.]